MNEQEKNTNIMADIGEAIKTMEAKEGITPTPTAEIKPEAKTTEVQKTTEVATPFAADDALIERAVKAGLSIADAKAFTSGEQADRILKMLEAKATPKTTETTEHKEEHGEGFPVADFEKKIKEMKESGEYSSEILELLELQHGMLKKQSDTIAEMRKAGSTAKVQSAFDESFNGLDEGIRSHVDAATKSVLKKKFDFLKAAHEAAKDGASDKDVFDEAKKLVLGDIVSQHEAENKAAEIAKRNQMVLARPGGASGLQGQQKAMTEADVAQMLFDAMTK